MIVNVGSSGSSGVGAMLATMAGGEMDEVGLAVLKKAMDASSQASTELIAQMPSPPAASGLGGQVDVRM
jgi:hypothetical protein